jgi:hypothetical protein
MMDDIDWLEKHWFYWYGNNGMVGEYLFETRSETPRTVKEIIKEMRDYQEKHQADKQVENAISIDDMDVDRWVERVREKKGA